MADRASTWRSLIHGFGRVSTHLCWFVVSLLMPVSADAEVTGSVRDAQTGLPMPGASVEIAGGRWASVVDSSGQFVVRNHAPPFTLRASHVGYAPVEVLADTNHIEIILQPAPFQLEEVTIDGRDPAYDIMRRVVERKQAQDAALSGWRSEVYTRQTLYGANEILAIRESVSELFRERDQGMREILVARHASANVPDSLAIFPAEPYLFDLYNDQIELLGQVFRGPVHPRAADMYHFRLESQHDDLIHISVQPRRDRPSLSGYLVVRDKDFTLVEARLRPNRRLAHPYYPSGLGFVYVLEQQFDTVAPGITLPVSASLEIGGMPGTSARAEPLDRLRGPGPGRALLRGQVRYVRYEIDAASIRYAFMAEDVFITGPESATWLRLLEQELPAMNPLQERAHAELASAILPLASQPQSLLLRLHEHMPAADVAVSIRTDPLAEETFISDEYLKMLISGTTSINIDSQISPEGPLPVRGKFTSESWINRVDGLHFGIRWRGENLGRKDVGLYLKGGYDLGAGRPTYGAGLRKALGHAGRSYLSLLYQAHTQTRYESSLYSVSHNSYPYLLSLGDYFDFYRSRGVRAEWGKQLGEDGLAEVGINSERHSSLAKETDGTLCDFQPENGWLYETFCEDRDLDYPANPTIAPGRLNSIDMQWRSGDTDFLANMQVQGEYAASWMGSDFSFARLGGHIDWRWLRGNRTSILPQSTTYRLQAGGALGDLPPQRHSALDVGLVAIAPFGSFKTLRNRPYEGEHYAAAFWEWRWGDGLYRPLAPILSPLWFLVKPIFQHRGRMGLGWAVHGGHGRTWLPRLDFDARHTSQWHHEAGVTMTLLESLNVDATWRLDGARRRRFGLSWVHSF
jgi:hypothetical protein